jgi:hypothetical protein
MRNGLVYCTFSVGFALSLFAIFRVDGNDLSDDGITLHQIVRLDTEHARHDLTFESSGYFATTLNTEVVVFVVSSI